MVFLVERVQLNVLRVLVVARSFCSGPRIVAVGGPSYFATDCASVKCSLPCDGIRRCRIFHLQAIAPSANELHPSFAVNPYSWTDNVLLLL